MTDFQIGDRVKAKPQHIREVTGHYKVWWGGTSNNEFEVRSTTTSYRGEKSIVISQPGKGGPQWPADYFELITKTKFKVGNVIKCIYDSTTRHIVSEVRADGYVRFDQFPDVGYFKPDAFDLWSDHEPKTNPAIVALVVDGKPYPSQTPYVHATTESATTEAERLSVANPGQVFAVYERVTARIADKPVARAAA